MMLSGWGNFPRADCQILTARGNAEIAVLVKAESSLIARGNGRAYGDAALNPSATFTTLRHNRMLAFDPNCGRLTCESGVLLADILDVFVPRGWFPPVTPGTKFVTVGGMIAADVHGKNHHGAGSFCHHVESLDLMLADGSVVTCSRDAQADLFAATCGGMGLTGIILSGTFKLHRIETAWIREETIRCTDLSELLVAFEASADWTYSVAWIDCLSKGRSLLYRGEHARLDELGNETRGAPLQLAPKTPKRVPFNFPDFAINRFGVRAFNEFYYRKAKPGFRIVDYDTYFYPLDGLLEWNRIYGRRGFIQYQCVLPKAASAEGMGALIDAISRTGLGSFLAVLKLFGPQQTGLISFPMEGCTLAVDFPLGAATLNLGAELDAIVAAHGGRLYLAKDARMSARMLRQGYPALDRFLAIRAKHGADNRFSSLLAKRLGL